MKEIKPGQSRAISITYDSDNSQIIVLREDGTIWRRAWIASQRKYVWESIHTEKADSSDYEKKYREIGI